MLLVNPITYQLHKGIIDGGWGLWAPWGECSVNCGIGVRTRRRECDNPVPSNEGSDCVGSRGEIQTCYRGDPANCDDGSSHKLFFLFLEKPRHCSPSKRYCPQIMSSLPVIKCTIPLFFQLMADGQTGHHGRCVIQDVDQVLHIGRENAIVHNREAQAAIVSEIDNSLNNVNFANVTNQVMFFQK